MEGIFAVQPVGPSLEVDWSQYDFVDFGCSRGGSIDYCQRRFSARKGLGIDLDPDKVRAARDAGYDAFVADARKVPKNTGVRFVSMLDFLEHLPSLDVVEQIIAVAADAAEDFLFIRHPSFEGEGYLAALGLRQYWWHWSGHTVHICISDYCQIFDRCGLRQYFIRYRGPILDSHHPTILTVDAPINQGEFDPAVHPSKPDIEFSEPIWRARDIFVALRSFEPREWALIIGSGR